MASRIREPAARAAVPEEGVDVLEKWDTTVGSLTIHSERQRSPKISQKLCNTTHDATILGTLQR